MWLPDCPTCYRLHSPTPIATPSKGLLQIYKANLATMDEVLQQLLSESKAAFALEAAELEVRTSRTEAGPVRCEVGRASVSAQPQTLCTPMQVYDQPADLYAFSFII